MRKLLALLITILPLTTEAQLSRLGENVSYEGSITSAFSGGDYAPFWFTSNRYGLSSYKNNYGCRDFYEEFLYDENEEVEFVYAANPDMQDFLGGEFRFYLKDGKLVKVLVKLRDEQTNKMEVQYEGKDIPETYKSQFQIYIDRANQIRKLCAAARAL